MSLVFENPLFLPFLSHGVVSPTLTCFTLAGTPFEGWSFCVFFICSIDKACYLAHVCIWEESCCFFYYNSTAFLQSVQLTIFLLVSSAQN
jgi:hypothetical protein